MKFVGNCILLLCSVTQVYSYTKGCHLPVSTDNEQYLPVLVDNSGNKPKLAMPNRGYIELNKGDKILLSCPNRKNYLELTNTESVVAECVKGETLKVSNKKKKYRSVLCANGLKGEALRTDQKCGGGDGYIIKLGFPQAKKKFHTLIESCYDAWNGNTLYVAHTLHGREMKYASKESYRPSFSTEEVAPDIDVNKAYKKESQKVVLKKLLGSAKLANKYIKKKSYLARGHLAADADFLFASWQFATYFYVNTVPQWQAINNGNWKRVETLARNAAASYRQNLKVYTGAYGVLSLPDIDGVDKKLYLFKKKLAVPQFIYKILHNEATRKAIAFVSVNNPFLKKLNKQYKLCEDICADHGWKNDAWHNGQKGFIYCCDARELLKAIATGPKIKIKGILCAPDGL